ncbi:hypothetical protein BT96DRAFT_451365 [Gymnopus androsaceus JB14]|uniref:DUF6697 domain-containing protein n=1 Tax=Gymnopus androsaceus JB14 TaxID=1447944 RepID=A0A6A4HWW5_9AGAR|nr:hypothetical protein BT96DRAFT_451365 [Gymnopus androsaceus JB14]
MQPPRNPSSTVKRSILFPFYDENPDLPANPGEPGLILTAREDILEIQPVTIFINYNGRKSKSPSVWLYCGEYILEIAQSLTGDQFSRLPEKTRNKWGATILKFKRDVWSLMRARIYLRKHDIPLTELTSPTSM